jgi:hypothetical protein
VVAGRCSAGAGVDRVAAEAAEMMSSLASSAIVSACAVGRDAFVRRAVTGRVVGAVAEVAVVAEIRSSSASP